MSRLQKGQIAPSFQTKDIFENKINLSDYNGKKLMLSFYRYASCPLCNLRINDLIKHYPEFHEKGLEMLAIFQSPAASITQYVGQQDAPFSIIPDPKHNLYSKYKVNGDWLKFIKGLKPNKVISAAKKGFLPGKIENDITMIPADFLINTDGTIYTAYYGKDAADHLPLDVIEVFLNQ